MKTFTAYIEWDPEIKLYVGMVRGIPGAHTQGASLDELHRNLKEVLELCLEEVRVRKGGRFYGNAEDIRQERKSELGL